MIELIQQKLASYNISNPIEEKQAAKEIIQEIALYSLWRSNFFEVAVFQGGTSLRILHNLPRFSEDLDFMLKKPNPKFDWSQYLPSLLDCFAEFGLQSEALAKGRMDNRIKKAIIKDNSVTNQLDLSFQHNDKKQKLKIKLEIDVNPPAGSAYVYTYLDFPLDFEVCHQDLASNFALKIHALLCRKYLKGRDWYDFNWYIKQGVLPNLPHLKNALIQFGPWEKQAGLIVDVAWLKLTLKERIATLNWTEAANDVRRFLNATEQKSLSLWSERFFIKKIDAL